MKTVFCLCTALIALTSLPPIASATLPYEIVDTDRVFDDVNDLARYSITIQVGNEPLNRFIAHRVVKVTPCHMPRRTKGPVILLPGGTSGFEMYGVGGDGNSIRDRLALAGFDVYGYSPRPTFLTPGFCDDNDCSAAANWGLDTYVDDIDIIAGIARGLNGFKKPVVGGFSLGAILSIAAIDRRPIAYQGAILLEGTLIQNDPAYQPIFAAQCDILEDALDAGVILDNQSGPLLQGTFVLGITDPAGDSPFYPGLTNEDFMYYLTTTPFDPPDGEAPGYTFGAGDMVSGWTYADPSRLLGFAAQVLTYDPVALLRDYKCGYASERTFTSNLSAFTAPVLSIQAGLGFGDANEATLDLMSNAVITRLTNDTFGHGDWYAHTDFDTVMMEPIITWLDSEIVPMW